MGAPASRVILVSRLNQALSACALMGVSSRGCEVLPSYPELGVISTLMLDHNDVDIPSAFKIMPKFHLVSYVAKVIDDEDELAVFL